MVQFTIKEEDEDFLVFRTTDEFENRAGIYIFSKQVIGSQGSEYIPLYVGQTKSLKNRLVSNHFKWKKALDQGMTHILIEYEDDELERMVSEGFYVGFYTPVLNE